MSSGPDLFQYYIRGVCELLSPVDNFSPSSRLVGAGSGSFRDRDGNEKNRPAGFDGLFCNAVGNELQGHVKTRLMAMLHQCVVSLNREVDEVVDPVLAMHQLRGLLAPAMIHDNNQDVKGEIETESRARKRLKVSNLKGESEYGDCLIQTKKIPYYYKDENGPCFRPSSRNDKENGEVNDDLQILLVNKGSAKKKMEKHSAEYSATLGRMEEKLEELLDMVITTCRKTSITEINSRPASTKPGSCCRNYTTEKAS
uniref:uncharacterized protein LOC122579293 isoform X2 n=1 Tax=Erigeron canadensis TaxID=72917 RepID=UPI001CB90A1A|nr:uncharacterized protein LOC122579293 isoform X2 [Erigeron canadensis]